MAVAWDKVRGKLASALPGMIGTGTVYGVAVYDGPVVTGDNPSSYLTIAATPSLENSTVGRVVQDQAKDGYSVTESGSVLCELGAVTGSPSVPTTFAIFDVIASWIQADQTLGGTLNPGSTCNASADVIQAQTTAGGVQRLIVTVTYFTRI